MISTAGLELTNFINTDLTWKKASKGNRRTTRRTRKLVTKNLMVGMELADNNHRRAEQTTVSESEKIGQGFSGKIEHVPIKKRKFNFRSPSPPPRTPSHNEVVQHASGPGSHLKSNENRLHLVVDASREAISSPDVVDVKISDSVNDKHGYREDFSGIEMLAAAACSDIFDAVVDHPEERPEVEEPLQEEKDSAMPMEETVSSPKTANCSPRHMVVEDRLEDSSFQATSSAFAQNSSSQKDDNTAEMSAPSRLHWDLNVVMDAWEQPCDTVSAGSQAKDVEGTLVVGSGKLHVLEGFESEKETKDAKHNDMVDRVVSSKVHEKSNTSSDLKGLSYGLDSEDNQLEASSHLDSNFDECGADPKASTQVVSLYSNIDDAACPNDMMSPPNYLEDKTEYCSSGVGEDETVCTESVHVEKFDVASTSMPVLDRVTCDEVDRTNLNEDGEDCARASSLHNDINAQEMMSVESCEQPEPVFHGVEPASEAEQVGVNNPSSKCENVAISSESMKEVQPMVIEVTKVEIDSSLHVQSDKLGHISSGIVTDFIDTGCELSTHDECGANASTNSSCKTDFEEPCDDIYESDTSQDDKVLTVCMENSRELQDGYDSQFEDGELRDSNVHCWEEENNCEGAEIEQVDYESECDGERFSILEAEDTDNKRKFESGSSPGSGDVTEKSEQCAVGDALGDSLTSSEARTSKAADGSKIKKLTADFEDESNGKDYTSRVVGSRASLLSDVLPRSGSNNFDDLCPRSERQEDPNKFMGRDRFSLHMRRRSPGGGRVVDNHQSPPCHGPYGSGRPRPRSVIDNHVRRKYMSSSSNNVYRSGGHIFNTRHSPPWHGPYGSGRPRPRSVIESHEFVMASDRTNLEATRVEGFDSRIRRHMNSSSNGVYRPLNRRSLAYRDDIYTGTAPIRDDISPDRSRFRRYPLRDDSRGIREDYCRPIPNYSTDDHMPHRLGRRERSISPLGGERLHCVQPYKKPQSRSRSRSPNGWFLLRERNEGSRRRSRSPTFRSARINRVRMPYKKRSEVEYEEGFISPQRNRFSPQCSSHFDDRVSGLDNLRDRKSSPPVRMFRQSQRFDPVRSIRSMIHPRRFTEMGGAGRGCKYEGAEDDDRRKQGNRYEIIDRVRRYNDNDGGVMRRLRNNNNNAEESSVATES